jgi:carbon monoxide dehydrogenase subunit G
MQIKSSFDVARPPAQAWAILLDIPKCVTHMPGVEPSSVEPGGIYKGRIAVKLGPVALKFNGTATLEDVNNTARTATIRAKGSDVQGRGDAGAVARMRVGPKGDHSAVHIDTELQLSGMVAQYGRASGVISAVATEMVSIFADNLRVRIPESQSGASEADSGTPAAGSQPRAPRMPSVLASSAGCWGLGSGTSSEPKQMASDIIRGLVPHLHPISKKKPA